MEEALWFIETTSDPMRFVYEHASEMVVAALDRSDRNPPTEEQAQDHVGRKQRLIKRCNQLEGRFNPPTSS
jgi:hypothetical protein